MSSAPPLFSKARVDVLEQSGAGLSDRVVYASDRAAAIRLTRALRRGQSIWVLLDVVLPSVRTAKTEFLGRRMDVGAGLGKIARLSQRPCTPVFWRPQRDRVRIRTAPPVPSLKASEEAIIQEFVSTQAAFIKRHPTQWLEWYSVLEEAPHLRSQVKGGNDWIWKCLVESLA